MKRTAICLLLAAFIVANTGCYGSFNLTKKFYKWNGSVGDKWVHSILFWVFNIIPVYGVCALADAIVLNVIEFWSGSNPMALNSDVELHKTVENNGKVFEVTMGKGKISIVQTKGPDSEKKVTLTYKQESAAWYLSDGKTSQMIVSFDPKPLNTVHLYYPDGRMVTKIMDVPDLAVAVR